MLDNSAGIEHPLLADSVEKLPDGRFQLNSGGHLPINGYVNSDRRVQLTKSLRSRSRWASVQCAV
jgi:hypothetical protein